jgi:hypothetical protein
MKTWKQIIDTYRRYLEEPELMEQARAMIRLVAQLRQHPELTFAYRGVAMVTGAEMETLLMWVPHARYTVYISSSGDNSYHIYVDHQGITPDTYYSAVQTVSLSTVMTTIHEYLRLSLKSG